MQNLFKPTHLKELCQQYGLTPSKRYGQNFLISQKPIEKMIKAADLKKADTVIEVGPGFGVLTLALAPNVKKVIAFEIEKKLEGYWQEKQEEHPNLEIRWGNFLKEFEAYSLKLKAGYKVVANLPYQITSNFLRTVLESKNKPEKIVVMVQKEVAERIVSKPPKMSLLSVSVQYYGEPEIIAKAPKGSFWPSPKVDSAIVLIDNIKDKKGSDEFFRVARAGFASKRKQLWRNLSPGLNLPADKVKQALLEVAGNEKARAQELSVKHWERVAERIVN